jgi:hypothetical protein
MGTSYKGRDAKVAVIAARFTDDEAAELDRAVVKASLAARKRGGTNYAKGDLVRAGVLDLARWINAKGDKHMDDVLAVLEEAMT